MTEENLSRFNDYINLRHRLSGSCPRCKAKNTPPVLHRLVQGSRQGDAFLYQTPWKTFLFLKAAASEPINPAAALV